jgi:glycerophosphoryl diester phosphodiesterase
VAALAVILATLGCPAHADSSSTYAPEISGHRGTRVGAPENTIPAMEYARRAGADYVEFDVRWTKDGVMVIMHDASVVRTTNCKGLVSSLTWAKLKTCDAGSWYGSKWKGTRVPTFGAVIRYAKASGMQMNAEVKMARLTTKQAREYVALIRKYGMTKRTIMSSPSHQAIRAVQASDRTLRTAAISQTSPDTAEVIRSYGVGYMPTWMIYTPEDVATLQAMGMKVFIWPIRSKAEFEQAYATRADVLVTDDPAALRIWLDGQLAV